MLLAKEDLTYGHEGDETPSALVLFPDRWVLRQNEVLAEGSRKALVINERLITAANFLCWVSTPGESCTGNSGNGLNRSDLMN